MLPAPNATLRKRKPRQGAQLAAEQQAISAPGAAAQMPPPPEPPAPPRSVPPAQPPPPPKAPPTTPPSALPPTPPQPVAVPVVGALPGMGGAAPGGGAGGAAGTPGDGTVPRGPPSHDEDAASFLDELAARGADPAGEAGLPPPDFVPTAEEVAGQLPPPGTSPNAQAPSATSTGNSAFDDTASDFLTQLLQGGLDGANTTEEEALIKQQMEDAIGQQLVDQRASMGRAGFASSGALAAMEGDTQRKARQQGLEDILGLRRTEDQRGIDNAQNAIGSDIDLRKQAEDEFFNSEFLNVLKSQLGAEGEGGGSSDPGAPPDPQGLNVPDLNGDGKIDRLDKLLYDKERAKDKVGKDGIIRANHFDPLDPSTWFDL